MTPHSLPSTNWEPSCEQALIDMVNQTSGKSPRMGYDCPICRNKEFVLTLENGLRRAKSCSCVGIRQNLTRLKTRGLLEPLKTCQVLYLDDFLKVQRGTSPTPADIRLAFEVLDARYNHGDKPVILSTEFNLRQIAGFDEALAGRIVERSRGFAVQIQGGPDRNHRFAPG